jgi:hypothetical protein
MSHSEVEASSSYNDGWITSARLRYATWFAVLFRANHSMKNTVQDKFSEQCYASITLRHSDFLSM